MKFKSKTWDGEEFAYAHWKLDGMWLTIEKNSVGDLRFLSSQDTDLTSVLKPLITTVGMLERVPCGMTLYGELLVPGKPASYVKSAIKHKDDRLQFVGFATSQDEAMPLEELEDYYTQWGVRFVPYTVSVPDALPYYGSLPIEGYVFKDGNRLNWRKWKPVKTIDLIVVDLKDGNGRFFGLTGALVCATTEGHVIANVSGMDDQTRIHVSDNESAIIGRVVEVAYQYVGAKGRLRHPRFVRFRDDKTTGECLINQDPTLETYYADDRKDV